MSKQSVRAIKPARFDPDAVMAELEKAVKSFGPELVKAFEQTTKDWQGEKPKFQPAFYPNDPKYIRLTIRVVGSEKGRNKWRWLDQGTKPHVIKPKRAKALRFKTGYRAGSRPGTVQTRAASRFGPEVRAQEVHHPGFPGRGWTEIIIADMEGAFAGKMLNAMARAAKASGHAAK